MFGWLAAVGQVVGLAIFIYGFAKLVFNSGELLAREGWHIWVILGAVAVIVAKLLEPKKKQLI